ncbi:MAG: oligosaccharide flippase family protein, partial [Tannerellaceae bacterium]|nr:oligosaccharide flippase family protein [Tannerellaceae bacterium]
MNKDNSGKHLKKGVIWTLFNRMSVLAMQFIAMIVLARFLSPADFAVVGIAMFFISISQTLLESGMGGALLRKQDVEDVDYSTLFIYNMGVGITMYLLLLILAKPIATFYNNEELALIINIIGLSIIASAFGKIQYVILLRELKFRQIATIAIISSSISLLIAVIMAIKGYGVWALVMQNLTNFTLITLLQFIYNRYFPRLRFSIRSFKEQWDFGSYLFYSHLLDTTYQNVFLLIFPKISSLSFSGLFTQANKIQRLPLSLLNSMTHVGVFPVLAKIDNEKLFMETSKAFTRRAYIVSFAVLFAISVFSEQSIVILLGSKWIDAAPILSI